MSLSSGNDVKTAVLHSPSANGSTEEIEMDADEDREILGVALSFSGIDQNSEYTANAFLWMGADEFPTGGNVNDSTKHLARAELAQEVDTTNGVGGGVVSGDVYRDFSDNPIQWDEHQTLTLQVNENAGISSIKVVAEVYYR